MTHAADFLMDARRALNAGDPRTAYLLATGVLLSEPGRTDYYLAAAESLRWLSYSEFAGLYELAASRPNDRDVILSLGQQILANGDAPLALAIARRAVDIEPAHPGSLALLALAGAADFQPALGLPALLAQTHLDFDQAFARAWCSLLCGEVTMVMNFIDGARADLRHPGLDPGLRDYRQAWLHYLEDCLARRVTVDEPAGTLKAWHFIQYGSAIVECCSDLAPGGGRFTATWKSYRQVTGILKAVFDLLIRTGRRHSSILAAPGRDSAILGRAAAAFLDLPFLGSAEHHTNLTHALIVAAHAGDLAGLPLDRVLEGQTVFAFDSNWLAVGHVVPDVCGVLSLSCTLPWHVETAMAHSAPRHGVLRVPSEAEVVQRLLTAEGETNESARASLPFYAERGADLVGSRAGSRRERFRRDSPVPTLQSWRGYA